MKMNLRNAGLRAATVAAGILVAVLLAELALRLIGFQFNLYPFKVQFGWPDPVTIKSLYKPDKELLWVQKDYTQRIERLAGSRPAIVFMGCSCTQFGKYDKFLAKIINSKYPEKTFTYINMGVGGWSTYQGLRQLKRDIVPMQPRVITIYYGWNDHWCTFGLEDKQIGRFNLENPEMLTTLSANSRVVQLINKSIFAMTLQGEPALYRVPLEDFRANLEEMVHVAREHAIIPVLLTAPSAHYVGEEPGYLTMRWLKDLSDLVPLHERYVQAVRDVAHEEKVDLVDLYRLFRDLPREEVSKSFKKDGIHLTEIGSRKIANYLHDYFVETGLIGELISR